MGKAKGRTRQDRRLIDMAGDESPPDPAEFEPYKKEDGRESWEIGLSPVLRANYEVWYDGGLETFFCITLMMVDEEGDDHEMVRIDCCHGQVHIHRFDRHGHQEDVPKVVRKVERREDVDLGHQLADDMLAVEVDLANVRWNRGS